MGRGEWMLIVIVVGARLWTLTAEEHSGNSTSPIVVVTTNDSLASDEKATETQQAICHIVTEKIAATANATVTHTLKGVCATKDLDKHFFNLKSEITNQVLIIKSMLFQIKKLLSDMQEESMDYANDGKSPESKTNEAWNLTSKAREVDIYQNNYTTNIDSSGNHIFSYFWRVESIQRILSRQDQHVVLRSPSFYVNRGYRMYMKMFPHQNGRNVYIHVGLTQGEFDETLSWPFMLKHQVMVLDQTTKDAEDISSRVWDPAVLCSSADWQRPGKYKDNDECVGFGFSQETIFTKNYLLNDSILIKLNIYVT